MGRFIVWAVVAITFIACSSPFTSRQNEDIAYIPPGLAVSPTPIKTPPHNDNTKGMEAVTFDAVSNLDTLLSYRLSLIMEFEGANNSLPSAGNIDLFLELAGKPTTRYLKMVIENSLTGEANAIELYSKNDIIYGYDTTNNMWNPVPDSISLKSSLFYPEKELTLPHTARCVPQPEIVNGVYAKHCSFDETDIISNNINYDNLDGNIWVAVDGNYIVKYKISATGFRSLESVPGSLFDSGSVKMSYEVTDINGSFVISLPPGIN